MKVLERALWFLCAVLVVVLFVEMTVEYSPAISQQRAGAAASAAGSTVATTQSAAIENYDTIEGRPLFSATRRPSAADVVAQLAAAPVTEDTLQLSAIVTAQDRNIALVQVGRDRQIRRVVQGEEVNGWTLAEVQPDFVILKKGGQTRRLELPAAAAPQTAGPAPVTDAEDDEEPEPEPGPRHGSGPLPAQEPEPKVTLPAAVPEGN